MLFWNWVRNPVRTNVTFDEQISSLQLLSLVKLQRLFSVITETVVKEFHKNLDTVRNETHEGAREILDDIAHPKRRELIRLAKIFEINIFDSQEIEEKYARVAAETSEEWVLNSNIIHEGTEVKTVRDSE